MADLATLQTWLTDAEAALQKLMTGAQEMQVDHGDMRVVYSKADVGRLQAYIADLRSRIVAQGGSVTGLRRRGIVVDL